MSSLCLTGLAFADMDVAAILANRDRRAAWERLVARGPAAAPVILQALDTKDNAAANWLRTAFDRIVADQRARGKSLDPDMLLGIVKDRRFAGRARRLARELVEEIKPGATQALEATWLDDPEFRYEAVEAVARSAAALETAGKRGEARAELQRAFAACRDLNQAKSLAVRLQKLDAPVSVARHFGFLMDWEILGPFDGLDMKGFSTEYPPERDASIAEAAGMDGKKLTWKPLHVQEPTPATPGHVALVNVREALGDRFDAVAYARVRFRIDKASEYELRGAADDNLSVWVNGAKAFGFDEYRNGVRFDRHRFKVKLQAGDNVILAKICQAPIDPNNPEPNWEFFLRLVDMQGNGTPVEIVSPKRK